MPYLKPFTAALAELARKYGVIVVLCTATQPALDGVFADLKIDLPIKEICPDVPENFETFRRTKIAQHTFDSTESLTAELIALPQVLCIVNRIADAQKIYQALPKDGAYCLTTHLCPAHRKARIKEIRERLKIGLPCRVVSTSLIEAGVDIESCTTPVYIPIDQGEALVERLYRGERSRTLFRKLGQYSVNVYPQQLAVLREVGAVQSIDGGALYVLADPRRYDSSLGLTLDQIETALFI